MEQFSTGFDKNLTKWIGSRSDPSLSLTSEKVWIRYLIGKGKMITNLIGVKIDQRDEGIEESKNQSCHPPFLSLSLFVNIHRRNSFTKHVRVLRARHLLRNQKKRRRGIAVWVWIRFQRRGTGDLIIKSVWSRCHWRETWKVVGKVGGGFSGKRNVSSVGRTKLDTDVDGTVDQSSDVISTFLPRCASTDKYE